MLSFRDLVFGLKKRKEKSLNKKLDNVKKITTFAIPNNTGILAVELLKRKQD
jgi:hypothetical protein